MVHQVKNLSPDQRVVLEALLGRTLREDESLTIRPSIVLKEAPTGEARVQAAKRYIDDLDRMGQRVKNVPEGEIEAAIDEAIKHVRRKPE
jgi:hypothetical protein